MGEILPFRSAAAPWPDQAGRLDRTAGLILQSGLRPWVDAARCGVDPLPEVRAAIAEAGGPPDSALSLNDLMYGIATQSLREVVIGCPYCEKLSPDETRLLHAVAEAAAGTDHPARSLAPFVRPAALPLLDAPLVGLARGLDAAGWRFRRRVPPGAAGA